MTVKETWGLLKRAGVKWTEDKASRLAAALAYFLIFAIAPLLVIAVAVIGFIYGEAAAEGRIVEQLSELVGEESAQFLQMMIAQAGQNTGGGIFATIIGIGILLYGATNIFVVLQDALNTIWEVQPDPDRGVKGVIRDRILSFFMVLGIVLFLLAAMIASSVIATLSHYIDLPGGGWVWHIIDLVVFIPIFTLLFAAIFRFLPDVRIQWKDVWVGAGFTAILFVIGKVALGIYMGYASVGGAYGPAGSLVALLIWVYYSSAIFLFGAEFTQAYARHHGQDIQPAENAIPLGEEDRDRQGIPHREHLREKAENHRRRQGGDGSNRA